MSASNESVTKRLQQELMTLMQSNEPSISAFPVGDNMLLWKGTIRGADKTVYEGLEYKLSLQFNSKYPFEPPVVRFETPCFHPNVSENGDICLDILKEKWSALYDTRTILLSIQSLLPEPNLLSPFNSDAAKLWENQEEFGLKLRQKYDEDVRQKKKFT